MRTHRHTVRRKTQRNNYRQSRIGRLEMRVMECERKLKILGKVTGMRWPYPYGEEDLKRFESMVWGAR